MSENGVISPDDDQMIVLSFQKIAQVLGLSGGSSMFSPTTLSAGLTDRAHAVHSAIRLAWY
jgi:hypothetical protein